ncbi:PREDICTED: uncharacterized protein LOC107357656 [Paramuricea clavata]|uniref:PREDICTED: uncharacterized protein LOC107357656 n=1 Tax=Paramuricea clavata TaxID=317549 RepID=A0A6S7FH80_PARCT|nr:PREDICTED: uncharacterized protein LOC107357656 [Paramuricea clavata]
MSTKSRENWEPGNRAESRNSKQIEEHEQSSNAKGESTLHSGGSAHNTGGKTQQVLPADTKGTNGDDRRSRTLSQKAIQNAIQSTLTDLTREGKSLKAASESMNRVLSLGPLSKDFDIYLSSTRTSYMKYKDLLEELNSLLEKDKWGELSDQAYEHVSYGKDILDFAWKAINNATDRFKPPETAPSLSSRSTRRSVLSRASSSSSASARRRAMAEAAAAKKMAEFDRIMAERENERKLFEAEEELCLKQRRAQHDIEMAILAAEKAEAIANAKLHAIEQSIMKEELPYLLTKQRDLEVEDTESRTKVWVDTHSDSKHKPNLTDPNVDTLHHKPETTENTTELPPVTNQIAEGIQVANVNEHINDNRSKSIFTPKGFAGNPPIFTPSSPIPSPAAYQECIEGIAKTNERVVASLARQNLPKCHPEVFQGDATLFHPWKKSFNAMIHDANLNPNQEMAYLRNYTKGKVRELVDNYRKRQQSDPVITLRDLWTEMGRRFGNTAIITNSLLQRLQQSAKFNGRDKAKLQDFADVCMDVDNQINNLPGLACLNYASAIRPIVDNLPNFLRFKWEKKVVSYAEENNDDYPGFHIFAVMMQKQAKLKNHLNVSAGEAVPEHAKKNDKQGNGDRHTKVYRTETKDDDQSDERKHEKHCYYHVRKGHELLDCKAFIAKKFEEKMEWLKSVGLCFRCLCFRCLSGKHRAKDCKKEVKCTECSSTRHLVILHKEKQLKEKEDKEVNEEVKSKCTSVCRGNTGGLSCSKIVLVDVFTEDNPNAVHRAYAIVDEQSNASMITPNLADLLEVDTPKEKYLLSTCSSAKETKYGRRVSGIMVKSLNGTVVRLPKLIECDHIPQEKNEIPTPSMTKNFPHLHDITNEIPPLDDDAKIEILLGRDAPELLKVRESRNGPKGALGSETSTGLDSFWPDVSRSQDNEAALSREDRQFLDIAKKGIHKNDSGNWEMPLPFRSEKVMMPNNRKQALNRLNGLLRTFKRKPQMQEDYLKFMSKVIDRGHAEVVPNEELTEAQDVPPTEAHHSLENVSANRCYHPKNFGAVVRNEIHAFSDASKEAVGVAAYLKQLSQKGEVSVSLVFGQAKVAPIRPTSIPRLELCAAVLSTKAVKKIQTELDLKIDDVKFYTDSKVVLGYISNDARRFHVYVANRVQVIRDTSEPHQWNYVDTSTNPADLATRGTTAKGLIESDWLEGPTFLKMNQSNEPSIDEAASPIIDDITINENDPEVKVNAYVTSSTRETGLKSKRFERFSDWLKLQRAVSCLIAKIRNQKTNKDVRSLDDGQNVENEHRHPTSIDSNESAKIAIIKAVQNEVFADDISVLKRENKETECRDQLKEQRRALHVVLVKDRDLHRNDWSMGRVTESIKSEDGEVRKAKVVIFKEGSKKTVFRPISELILLISAPSEQ